MSPDVVAGRIIRSLCPLCIAALRCALALLAMVATAQAESLNSPPALSTSFPLKIPAQSLGDALEQFSRVTGIAVLMDGEYAGLRVSGVQGDYRAREALAVLLRGTRLTARWYASAEAFAVGPGDAGRRAEPRIAGSPAIGVLKYRSYAGYIQGRLWKELCRHNRTRPGNYRLAVQLWIGSRGVVEKVALLSSTGDRIRDAAVIEAIMSLSLDRVPAHLPQPVTVLLTPGPAFDCSA